MSKTALTRQQQAAASARGNVLVVAGAGAGKTRTLVERCLAWLLDADHPGSVDELLMVTFTQAAAAEMRQRLRDGLERAPIKSARLAEQEALLDAARICTLHSFCFELVSQHFYELGLDPQLKVLSNEESYSLERRAMDGVLESIYDSEEPADAAIQKLIQMTGGDADKPLRQLIVKLHHYGQTLRDPEAWFAGQHAMFSSPEPREWRMWLAEALEQWRGTWLPILESQPPGNINAAKSAAILKVVKTPATPENWVQALAAIKEVDKDWAHERKKWREPIEKFFEELEFLDSLCAAAPDAPNPLMEDWNWARPSMLALLDVTRRFADAYSQAKRNFGGIDFHDLEQFALRLLWNGGAPSAIAMQWRAKLRLIFVDEFQDINAAQEAIILALAREGEAANRFLVGDVKQSIYRFRLADPRIFVKYKADWELAGAAGRTLLLSENFRSHEGILNFVNALFAGIMRKSLGGVEYDEAAKLVFGDREGRAGMAISEKSPAPVELLLRRKGDPSEDQENASDAEKEARMVGRRLLELRHDAANPAPWNEMVILLRAPRNKTAAYAKEFSRLGIPLAAARGGFFDSPEARDFLGLLQLLDNPLQDLPLLGVLRSPIVGMTDGELAEIRIAQPRGRFWEALVDWHAKNQASAPPGAMAKTGRFLQRYRAWRGMARQEPVSQCLETMIDSTHYADWLATQPRGGQGRANLERLLQLARQFDSNRGESLSRFLGFMEAQQESDDESEPAPITDDAVRLMSIHQSKGLEFPVVVVADLGKRFNVRDLSAKIILDEELGLCPRVRPPDAVQTWPSLPYWLAQRHQRRELVGEELRLLYVAMTRAEKRLILAGTATQKTIEEKWPKRAQSAPEPAQILSAGGFMDWIGSWPPGGADLTATGANVFFRWTICDDDHPWLARAASSPVQSENTDAFEMTPETRERLDWRYAFTRETQIPAKASVSALRREMAPDALEETRVFRFDTAPRSDEFGASEIGLAHHAFLEKLSLERAGTLEGLRVERARMESEKALSPQEIACLDLEALAAFWNSSVGRQILKHRARVRRELAFTVRFGVEELSALGSTEFAGTAAGEFVIVQGVIDLAVFLPNEIWLLDFKTDHFKPGELQRKIDAYRPQIELYAAAISRVYNLPVRKRWLHFIASRHTVVIGSESAAPAGSAGATQLELPGLVSERPVH